MRTEQEMVAYALEIEPDLLPFIPELLADLEELGSDSELIVEVLQSLNLPSSTQVIDLGCGKGAVSVEIAETLGFQVLGVDLFAPFIPICQNAAKDADVSHLCSFRHANILTLTATIEPVDVALYAALGDVLGTLSETVGIIRQFVKPGGYFIICDNYLREGCAATHSAFEYCTTRDATLAQLTAFGDCIVQEVIESSVPEADDIDENNAIRRRAEQLAIQYPELADALLAFVHGQEAECEFIEENLVSATWLLQRCENSR